MKAESSHVKRMQYGCLPFIHAVRSSSTRRTLALAIILSVIFNTAPSVLGQSLANDAASLHSDGSYSHYSRISSVFIEGRPVDLRYIEPTKTSPNIFFSHHANSTACTLNVTVIESADSANSRRLGWFRFDKDGPPKTRIYEESVTVLSGLDHELDHHDDPTTHLRGKGRATLVPGTTWTVGPVDPSSTSIGFFLDLEGWPSATRLYSLDEENLDQKNTSDNASGKRSRVAAAVLVHLHHQLPLRIVRSSLLRICCRSPCPVTSSLGLKTT